MKRALVEQVVGFVAWLTFAMTICFLGAQTLLLGAFIVNGDEGVSDNWVGYLSVSTLFATLVISLIALGFAIWAAVLGISHRFAVLMRYEFLVLIVLVAVAELLVFE